MRRSTKKNNNSTLEEIFLQLGVSNQIVSYWRNHQASGATALKYSTLISAADLFQLSYAQTEELANKTGLTLLWHEVNLNAEFAEELYPFDVKRKKNGVFIEELEVLLSPYFGKFTELSNIALMTDRTLRYIKSGKHLSKSSIVALLIAMGLNLENIQWTLRTAGIILSESLPNDIIIIWMLNNEKNNADGGSLIYQINETLSSMGLPMLNERQKVNNK